DIPAKDMIDIRSPNIDWSGSGRFYGWPIPRSNAAAVDSEAAMWDRLVWHFKNFSPPGLHYKTDQPLNRIQLKQAVGDSLSQHRLAEHSGRPIFSHSGFEATEFRNSIREMDYAKSLDFTIELELATFGVPKALVGMIESFNRANLVAAQAAACEHTIAPIQSHMMQHLTQNLGREFDERIVIVQEECRPNDPEQKRKNVETLLKFHTITANEAREVLAEGLVGPLKRGGDTILGPIQLGELPRGNEEITNEPEEEPRNEEPNDDASEDRSLSVGGNGRAGGIDGPVLGCVSCGDDERHKFILDKAREVQSVVFAKDNWSVSRARGWLRSHGFKAPQPDITPNTYRFRQFPPSQCSGGFATLTENMPKGVSMVACERRERRGGDNDRTVSVWHGERLRGRHSLSDQRITGNSFSCGRTAVLGAEGTATDTAIQKEQEREQEFGVILEKETEASASGRNPEDSKAAFVQMWLKQHGRIEERFADVIVRFLRGQKRRVLTRLNELGMAKPGDETKLLPAGEEDRGLMEVANQQIEQAMAIGASLELEREPTRAMHFMETKPRVGRVDIPEDVFQAIRQSIGETFGVRYWQENFSNHTRNKIRRVLKVSVEEGQSVAQLAKTIRNDSPQLFSRTRAFTVARTESTGALNGGQSIVQDQLMADGVIDARSWQAT
ncbi:MAG: phage portal protein, partial [Acidobacteriota bacterium]